MRIEHLGFTYELTSKAGNVTASRLGRVVASAEASADGLHQVMGRVRADAKRELRGAGQLERLDGTRHADYSALASDLEEGAHGVLGLAAAWFLRGNRLNRAGVIDACGCVDPRWAWRKGGHSFDAAAESVLDTAPEWMIQGMDFHEVRDAISEVIGAGSIKALAELAQSWRDASDPDRIAAEIAEYEAASADVPF